MLTCYKDLYITPSLEIWGKAMKKKILIGSMLVLTLLLLMPSIPAIQQKTIEDKAYNDLEEKLDIMDIKELINKEDRLKHPLLYLSVFLVAFRGIRGALLIFSSSNFPAWYGTLEIYYPLIFLRGLWLCGTTFLWQEFWVGVAKERGWNWGLQ